MVTTNTDTHFFFIIIFNWSEEFRVKFTVMMTVFLDVRIVPLSGQVVQLTNSVTGENITL